MGSTFLDLFVEFEDSKESGLFLFVSLGELNSGEHLTFIDLPLHGDNTRLPFFHDAHGVGLRY